jgi:hypothetical protein
VIRFAAADRVLLALLVGGALVLPRAAHAEVALPATGSIDAYGS